jgi:transcriptional regulator with XRE-family HTH domain
MPVLESFPSFLKAYRKSNGLTQIELAELLGYSMETISAWERGKRTPHLLQIPRLARLLGIEAHELTQSLYPAGISSLEEYTNQEPYTARLQQNSLVSVFSSQDECIQLIRHAVRHATKVKVLTIRGEKYFLGPQGILHNLYSSKHSRASSVQVLVLSLDSDHVTEELAADIGHDSPERIREKMSSVHGYLKFLMSDNKNFEVRSYKEKPNFKMLIFDDVMFVSSFIKRIPKNDQNAKMFQLTREDNPLFMGLERHFDDLWSRSANLL